MTSIVPINKAEFAQLNSVEKSNTAIAKEPEQNTKAAVETTKTAPAPIRVNVQISGSATNQSAANKEDIKSEQVRVSTSLGQSDIRGNLSHTEAVKIYENIAKLI